MGVSEEATRGLSFIDEWRGREKIPVRPVYLLRCAYTAVISAILGQVSEDSAWTPAELETYRNVAIGRSLEAAYNLGAEMGHRSGEGDVREGHLLRVLEGQRRLEAEVKELKEILTEIRNAVRGVPFDQGKLS